MVADERRLLDAEMRILAAVNLLQQLPAAQWSPPVAINCSSRTSADQVRVSRLEHAARMLIAHHGAHVRIPSRALILCTAARDARQRTHQAPESG